MIPVEKKYWTRGLTDLVLATNPMIGLATMSTEARMERREASRLFIRVIPTFSVITKKDRGCKESKKHEYISREVQQKTSVGQQGKVQKLTDGLKD